VTVPPAAHHVTLGGNVIKEAHELDLSGGA
jgi:hypothetical protein